jgi:ribosomal protein S18 acetylase RimI-like enzyme
MHLRAPDLSDAPAVLAVVTARDRAELGVASDNPDALKLYERLGMRPRFQSDTYERELTTSGQSPDR